MTKFIAWFRQPTTMAMFAIAVASAVYWFTRDTVLASMAAAAFLGTVSDSTASLLAKIESLEDTVRKMPVPTTVAMVATDAATVLPSAISIASSAMKMLLLVGLVGALTACGNVKTSNVNGVRIVTINLANIDAQAAVFGSAASAALQLPGIAGTSQAAMIGAAIAKVQADVAMLDHQAGGSAVLALDPTSAATVAASLLADAQTLLDDTQGTLPFLSASDVQNAKLYIAVIDTGLAIVKATIQASAVAP